MVQLGHNMDSLHTAALHSGVKQLLTTADANNAERDAVVLLGHMSSHFIPVQSTAAGNICT